MSRTENSLRNVTASIGGQLLNNGLKFLCRTAFIYTLGQEYLGISSLYANILSILSVSELGFSSAITYSLYRPLAEHNVAQIQSLMDFFKKAYRVIGIVILLLGLALFPFLPQLMTGTTDVINIYLYYLLYLLQTVVSYLFFAYKAVLLIADQKKYLNDLVLYITQGCMNLAQIALLFWMQSFFVYTIAAIVSNVVQNIAVSVIVDRKYPYLSQPAEKLSRQDRCAVFSQVYATALYRISTIIGTATDNLIISSNISVLLVGLYDNYNMIIQVIQKLIQGAFQAVTSSLGNYYVLEGREQNEFLFRCLNLLNNWLIVFCSVSFLVLLQPFIQLWIGEAYLLSNLSLVVVVSNFATNYLQNVVQIYKNASGLFVRGKYRAVATAVLNLLFSILLVRIIGLPGVFLGSIISRMVTTWWYDAWILYHFGFHKSPAHYFVHCGVTMLLIYAVSGLIQLISAPIAETTWMSLFAQVALCVLIANGAYLLIYGRSPEFRYLIEHAKRYIGKKIAK